MFRWIVGARRLLSLSASVPSTTKQEAQMYLQFQCTYDGCEQSPEDQLNNEGRMVKKFISKLAYTEGVVLVRCKCEKLHLIADRLEWFEDGGTDIEKIAQQKGLHLSRTAAGGGGGADYDALQQDMLRLAKEKGIHVDVA